MSKWSSFEQDQEYTEDWRQYLESQELEEGIGDTLEKGRQRTAGAYDWIANFLSGTPKDKDYSHLNMPTPDIPTAKGAEPEGEQQKTDGAQEEERALNQWAAESAAALFQAEASGDTDALRRAKQQLASFEEHEREAVNRHLADLRDNEKVHSKNPASALNESQTYDRWKVLSGIKKKVI